MDNKRSILTYTGKVFDFWEPALKTICIKDIAHALALTNRYGGHTTVPYSVAEHCERMSYLPGDPLVNLLHDAAEAYIGDIPSPQKKNLGWSIEGGVGAKNQTFKILEENLLAKIYIALGVPLLWVTHCELKKEIKKADLTMLATEVRDLMSESTIYFWWTKGIEPLEEKIYPIHWALAEDQFLMRFKELTGE